MSNFGTRCNSISNMRITTFINVSITGCRNVNKQKRHLPYGITQCHLLPDTGERTAITPARPARTRFTFPGEMKG